MSDRADPFRSARIALIGCGAAAATYRAALRRLGIRPTLYVDTDLAAARRLAGSTEIAQKAAAAFDRFDAAIVTGIGVSSADELRDLTLAAKPILCGPEVLAAATRSGWNGQIRRLARGSFAGSHLRFAPNARVVRSLLNSGRLGSMVSFHARLGGPPARAAASSVYWDADVVGGGVLVDPGMHVLDLLAWWLGPLTAATLRDDSAGGLEAEAIAHVSIIGGPTGIVELSRMRALRNSVVLTGAHGHIEFDLERMTLRAEPPALVDSLPEPAGNAALRDGIVADMHRRRLEGWLDACVLRTSPAPDELADSNAIEALIDLYATRKRFLQSWERAGPTLSSVVSDATSLAEQSVLVTGGTGFIGARLTERLVELGAKVTVAVRNFRHAARIARLDVNLIDVDLHDPGNVDDVVGQHEVVFSLAYDFKRSGAANVALHRNLAAACVRRGVRRFVHLSSIAVYDDWPTGALDERSPKDLPGSEYKIAKRAIEVDLAQRAASRALSSAILQPTIVYGPFSTFWTDQFAVQLLAGKIVLPRDGFGRCSGVYVDDLVHALLTAAARAHANAETWIISGSRSFDWAELLGGYAETLGKKIEYDDSPQTDAARSILSSIRRDPARIMHWRPLRRMLGLLSTRLGEERVDRLRTYVMAMRRRHGPVVFRPSDVEPLLYFSKGSCSIEKARQELNFAPAFELDEGLERTQAYLRWRYLGTPVDALEP